MKISYVLPMYEINRVLQHVYAFAYVLSNSEGVGFGA